MTLRVTVEIVPFGKEEQKRELLTLNISNISHEKPRGVLDPDVYVVEKNDYKNYDYSTPRVHHFREDGFEALVIAALERVR